jgi:hypothetical protein
MYFSSNCLAFAALSLSNTLFLAAGEAVSGFGIVIRINKLRSAGILKIFSTTLLSGTTVTSTSGLSSVRGYLGSNGDAIDARVRDCLRQARELKDLGYFQSSQVLAATGVELIVRFLLIRPLLQGAFLSDEWAYFITQKVASGHSAEDRKLLPEILKVQAIDIRALRLPSGKRLWDTILTEVYPKRNRVLHASDPATAEEAETAIDCATRLYSEVVVPIAKKLGFTLENTGRWSVIRRKKGEDGWAASFVVSDPFK